jgi:low affinity Fe/Cu permease
MAHDNAAVDRNGGDISAPAQGDAPRGLGKLPDLVTRWAGSRWTSTVVAAAVVVLFIIGGFVGFTHGWQVFVHTAGAVVSVLMLFLLQHTTNRETKAILVKLDELIQATGGAREQVMDIEDHEVSDQEELHHQLHHRSNGGSRRQS